MAGQGRCERGQGHGQGIAKCMMIAVLYLFNIDVFADEFAPGRIKVDSASRIESHIALGPGYSQSTEKLLFGELHRGFGVAGLFGLQLEKNGHRHELSINGIYATVASPDGFPALYLKTDAAYAYLHRFSGLKHPGLSWYLGPEFASRYSFQFYSFLDDSHGYWLTRYDLGLLNRMVFKLNNRVDILGRMLLPVAGIMSRPAYRRNYNSDRPDALYIARALNRDLAFSSWGDYRAVQLLIAVRYRFNRRWSEALSYTLDYRETDRPVRLRMLDQKMLMHLYYLF